MIKMVLEGRRPDGSPASSVVLGLDAATIAGLIEGKTLMIKPEDLPGLQQSIMIAFGTDGDLVETVRSVFPQVIVDDRRRNGQQS